MEEVMRRRRRYNKRYGGRRKGRIYNNRKKSLRLKRYGSSRGGIRL